MVWCGCVGEKEGWRFVLLHWLPLTQHMNEEGFLSTFTYPRGDGEPSRSGTILLSWPEVRFLAGWDGWWVNAVYGLHHWEPQILQSEQMLFGLCITAATFLWLMQNCLGELNLTYCLIYLENVIVFSKRGRSTCIILRVVFNWFYEHNLRLMLTKCEFFKSEIN